MILLAAHTRTWLTLPSAGPSVGWRMRGRVTWKKNLPLATRVVKLAQDLGNIWTWLSEHPLKGGVCTLSLGKLAIPYPGYKHHCCAKGHHQSAPCTDTHMYTVSARQALYFQRNRGDSVKIKVQGEAVASCSGWVSASCDKRDSLAPWPCHSLFLAVREGNAEEQRRKDWWAINRFYTSAYTQLGNTAWWALVEIKSPSVCGKIYCNTCNISIWQWRHHTYLVWKMCFFPPQLFHYILVHGLPDQLMPVGKGCKFHL